MRHIKPYRRSYETIAVFRELVRIQSVIKNTKTIVLQVVIRVLRNSNCKYCKYSENARNRTLYTYLHVADDEHVRVVGPHGDVGFVQMFQYLDGHARVAELEQLERRRQVELELVNADGHVVRQLRVVQIFGPGIRQRRGQQVEVDRGLYGKQETRTRHPRYHGCGGGGGTGEKPGYVRRKNRFFF